MTIRYGTLSNISVLAICESVFAVIVAVQGRCIQFGFLQQKAVKKLVHLSYILQKERSVFIFWGGREGKGFSRTYAFIPIKVSVAFNLK